MTKKQQRPQTVVVTGASAGIGRAAAIAFGARGDRVALLARGDAGLQGAAQEVRGAGGQAMTVSTDVAEHDQIERAAVQVEAQFGEIDVWVNVAFTSVFAPVWEIEPAEFERVTKVTYLGFVYGTMTALRRFRPRDRGTIVQVGSALAYRGIPLQSAYCGGKHAIQGFNEALRCELLHEKSSVHTTMVQMPGTNTPQFTWVRSRLPDDAQPVPPIYQPEIPGRAVVYAAEHPRRREYWVGGSTVGTLLANAVVPGILDRYLGRTGFSSQQTDQRREPDQPDNLFSPADQDRDYGTHGPFDEQATDTCYQLTASHNHVGLAVAAAAAGAGMVGLTVTLRRRLR
ncbi:hypothetical protein GCM10011492_27290 [Flexivirga endophytica]|uniref:SDR family NAD(P)-dependent oxidoreductase n=1 Tax=Flexivirga endophytica TaxID=1849103 RepID=A0A916T811_9MICO|nr:SDR family oxidoreductase [Flexivirga endophytica]GGB35167.1 hypothetical protein GCM10011492_27290 [Flexivirga endophytica]GHB42990.1 hypothetical protein GCM10008112_09670 [Flexivirga endophytica]